MANRQLHGILFSFSNIEKRFGLPSPFPPRVCMALFLAFLAAGLLKTAAAAAARHHPADGSSAAVNDKAPGGPGRAAPTTLAPVSDADRLALQMLQMINDDRISPSTLSETKGQALPLQWDPRLAAVAKNHSEEMASTGTFSHVAMDGSLPMNRVSKAGIRWLATGENIAKASTLSQAEGLFMNEPKFQPNHRGNILDTNYNRVGIGIAVGPDGSLYITQEFAEIP